MKKRRKGRSLSRTSDQRKALLRTLLVSLVSNQQIKTTLAKAKELRPFAERSMTHAKIAVADAEKKIAKVRLLQKALPEMAVRKMLKIAEVFKDRTGGYIRIVKIGHRQSDASPMALVQWVENVEVEESASVRPGLTAARQGKKEVKAKAVEEKVEEENEKEVLKAETDSKKE